MNQVITCFANIKEREKLFWIAQGVHCELISLQVRADIPDGQGRNGDLSINISSSLYCNNTVPVTEMRELTL